MTSKFVVVAFMNAKPYFKLMGHGWTKLIDHAFVLDSAGDASSLLAYVKLRGGSKLAAAAEVREVRGDG